MARSHYSRNTIVAFLVAIICWNYFQFESFLTVDIEGVGSILKTEPNPIANSTHAQKRWEKNEATNHSSTDTQQQQQQQQHQKERQYKHDFSYDRERWEENRPRIGVLAGPHKTASTTLQAFFANIAGKAVHLTNETFDFSKAKNPHPSITDWVWPLGVREEYEEEESLGGGFSRMAPPKFYSVLASLISGRRRVVFFAKKTQEVLDKAREYHRALFRRPWDEGKKIVIAAEAFDTLVEGLVDESIPSDKGEETHVSPASSEMIDALLDVFPWDDHNASTNDQIQPLQLEDIEVHINYRTPRISHVKSIWHQLGKRTTLRKFLYNDNYRQSLYQSNSLALALQFVRRGIKTSILDMTGAMEKFSEESLVSANATGSNAVVGGMQGVVACEILRMGEENGLCDEHSRLHLPDFRPSVRDQNRNQKADKNVLNLTPEQMDEINRVMEEYDCGVWQHLQKYQAKGTLRILYPSENLFASCDPEGSRDISFESTMKKLKEIASRENGIPRQTKEEEDLIWMERKKQKEAGISNPAHPQEVYKMMNTTTSSSNSKKNNSSRSNPAPRVYKKNN